MVGGTGEENLRVAILEDDPDQAEIASLWLQDAGCNVFVYPEAHSFLQAIRRDSFDLYLLDWVLPDISGIEALERLRGEFADTTPAIVATVKDEEMSIVRALESGADDYIVKPIRRNELVARVNAILRRTVGQPSKERIFAAAPYEMDLGRHVVSLQGKEIALTNREFALAVFLFRNAGKMMSRRHLLEEIWGIENESVSTRTVDTHISRLRKKLALNEENGWKLSSIYQHGYRIEKTEESMAEAAQR